ncbi:hypothetical protein HPB50_026674 [Hyalomma asiaticum]|uniref:Uncharacterized protein n=1 Tax=Hyalomma asiaticum TaxID=266040 RepID=A0ACB7TRR5_HYAAI|nr:hypothetical protein HPB50_026674 [Hyalomma asiaticum]
MTFANTIICLSTATHQWLERGQHKVGQLALSCLGVWRRKLSKTYRDGCATRPGRREANSSSSSL